MEGVASEAASLAGHLQLGNLIYVSYPRSKCQRTELKRIHSSTTITVSDYAEPHGVANLNAHSDISIDGDTAVAFTENVEQRFLSYGWQVLHVDDGDKCVISGILCCERMI